MTSIYLIECVEINCIIDILMPIVCCSGFWYEMGCPLDAFDAQYAYIVRCT